MSLQIARMSRYAFFLNDFPGSWGNRMSGEQEHSLVNLDHFSFLERVGIRLNADGSGSNFFDTGLENSIEKQNYKLCIFAAGGLNGWLSFDVGT